MISRLLFAEVMYSLNLDLIDPATYTFRANLDSIKIIEQQPGTEIISDFYGTRIPNYLEEPAV